MAEGRVEDIYDKLKLMAVNFRIRPGDRLNEVALSRELGVSRTPLREALNRLVAERLLDFRPGTGFFCRTLEPKAIFDLYEMRKIIESSAARLAVERASDNDLRLLQDELYETGVQVSGLTIAQACARDEAFHLGIARLSGNHELVTQLDRTNERIRYIRWVSMSFGKVRKSKAEHKATMQALLLRDGDLAAQILQDHITKRMDEITEAVRHGISNIYMEGADALSDQIFQEAEA